MSGSLVKAVAFLVLAFAYVKTESNNTIRFPCLKHLEAIPDAKRNTQELPRYLRENLMTKVNQVEFFTRLIETVEEFCNFVERKVSAVFISMYNVDLKSEEIGNILLNQSDSPNETFPLKRMAQLHLLSSKLLIEETLSMRSRFCDDNGRNYNPMTMSCDEEGNIDLKSKEKGNQSRSSVKSNINSTLEILKVAGIIGNGTSTLFLVIMFAVYAKCKNIQSTLPSKCIICLSITQSVLHILQIIAINGIQQCEFCTGVSILSHWLSLSSFLWLCFVSCEKNINVYNKYFIGNEKRFVAYMWVAFGLSAIIVSVCAMLNFSTDNLIGYGRDGFCFISHTMSHLMAFIFPISLIFTANFVFTALVCRRRRTFSTAQSNFSSSVTNESNKYATFISVITLILSSEIITLRILEFLPGPSLVVKMSATFVLSLQGVFFFAAFACNRTIWTELKKLLKNDGNNEGLLTYKYTCSGNLRTRQGGLNERGVGYNFKDW